MELTEKERDIILCAFDILSCTECAYWGACNSSDDFNLEGRRILVKLGIINK